MIKNLFAGGKKAEKSWHYFLENYSSLIFKIIRTFARDYDDVMNKYVFICSQLSANSFAKLKKYKGFDYRKAKFPTWIKVVVSNLCLDEIRKVKGRKRYPTIVSKMTEDEKQIFKLYYWNGLTIPEIAARFNHIREEEVIVIIERINDLLNGKAIAGEKMRNKIFVQISDNLLPAQNSPNNKIEIEDFSNFLIKKLNDFPSRDRMIIKLKYWNDWPVKEISSFMDIPSKKIYKILNNILKALREDAVLKKNM